MQSEPVFAGDTIMERESQHMPKDTITDLTKTMTIEIPCSLAERAEKYAKGNGTSLSGVVIEALAVFLGGQNAD
jgi:hypothetical protein